jgi:integrase
MASIYPARNGRWTAQVNIGGKRKSKAFDTKVEARRWARHQEVAVDAGAKFNDMTFGDLVEEYIGTVSETKEISRTKLNAITNICKFIGRVPVDDMDVATFRDFVRKRRNSTSAPGPSTIGMDLTFIHTILSHGGALTGTDTAHALAGLKAARIILTASDAIARSDERTRRPTDAELVTLHDFWAKRRRGTPMWTVTQFAAATSMRLGEILRIRWDDTDRVKRTIVVRDRKHPRAKKGNNQIVPLLSGPCVIDGEVVDPIALIDSMAKERAKIFPFDSATISTMFTRAVKSCGIDDLRFHDLRHDGVSRLFEAGYPIEQVAMVSGHKDWNMLRRYTQLAPEALHRG